jgi:glycogen debranching enzyme
VPADSPWLWQHMTNYTTKMAEVFHGFRIDNCHSTPIHVAQYLLDAARKKRGNLYVVCELFTGSEEIDALYVTQLGITSLIREAMSANDSWELGRLCHRHGGNAVAAIIPRYPLALRPCLPGALFMDCTHDNQTPSQKRTPEDCLPNSAIVSMAVSAVGSVRGYDELIYKHIDVVRETRQYPVLNDASNGIAAVKCLLNKLHQQLALDGYGELHVHQEGNMLTIQRHHPTTHEATYMIVHTAFSSDYSPCHSVRIPGKITDFLFATSLSNTRVPTTQDPNFLYGLDAELHFVKGRFIVQRIHVIKSFQVVKHVST